MPSFQCMVLKLRCIFVDVWLIKLIHRQVVEGWCINSPASSAQSSSDIQAKMQKFNLHEN